MVRTPFSLPDGYHHISVNVDRPEANCKVFVYWEMELQSVKNKDDLYGGFFVCWRFDYRWIADDDTIDWCKGRVFSENKILLSIPAYDYAFLNTHETVNRNLPSDPARKAMNNARSYFKQDEKTRKLKHLLLEFPLEAKLSSSKIFADAGKDKELDINTFFVSSKHAKLKFPSIDCYAGFEVASKHECPYKKGTPVNNESKTSKMARKVMSMDVFEGP
jgi:hypothetical protein